MPAPAAIVTGLPIPNSKSHSTNTTTAVKMPPTSDGSERLTGLAAIGQAGWAGDSRASAEVARTFFSPVLRKRAS